MSSPTLLRKQVSSERKKRRLILFTVVFLIFSYLFISLIFGDTGLFRYMELKNKKAQIEREIKFIETKNARLKSDLKIMKENPFYIEKHARENFGMAKPDEYIYNYEQ